MVRGKAGRARGGGWGGHKCDEFCRYFAGSQLCLFAGEEGSGLAMGCEEEEGGLEGG